MEYTMEHHKHKELIEDPLVRASMKAVADYLRTVLAERNQQKGTSNVQPAAGDRCSVRAG